MGASTVQDDKKKALGLAIAQIEKSHGKGAIM
jgi:RecA/RadA recombinase